jgi:hypothetical protein
MMAADDILRDLTRSAYRLGFRAAIDASPETPALTPDDFASQLAQEVHGRP